MADVKLNRKDAARVKKLEAERLRINNEIAAITEPYEQQRAQNLVGLCFKVRNNYSCPEKPSDYWWLYVKVLRIGEHGTLHGLQFQVDKDGCVFMEPDKFWMPHTLESYQTVSQDEFNREFARMVNKVEQANVPR